LNIGIIKNMIKLTIWKIWNAQLRFN